MGADRWIDSFCHGPNATGPDYAQLKHMSGIPIRSNRPGRDQRRRVSQPILAVAMSSRRAACAADTGGESADAAATADNREPSTKAEPIGESPNTTDGLPPDLLAEIVRAGATEAGVEPDAVEVVVAEAVTWSDGSIGCPEPGMMYTQALVPGYRLVLEVDGRKLNFHATESGDFRYCENPRPPLERNPNE